MRVLLLERDGDTRATLMDCATSLGHQVKGFARAGEALAHITRNRGELDLVVSGQSSAQICNFGFLNIVKEYFPLIDMASLDGQSVLGINHGLEVLDRPVGLAAFGDLLRKVNTKRSRLGLLKAPGGHRFQEWRRQEDLDRQTEIASAIQETALHGSYPWLRQTRVHLTVYPRTVSLGGFVQVRPYGDQQSLVLLGKISGSGTPGALGVLLLKAWFSRLEEGQSVSMVLRGVKQVLETALPDQFYATALCGILDDSCGRFEYAVAGHASPIVLSNQSTGKRLPGLGMPLSSGPHWEIEEGACLADHGDVLICATNRFLLNSLPVSALAVRIRGQMERGTLNGEAPAVGKMVEELGLELGIARDILDGLGLLVISRENLSSPASSLFTTIVPAVGDKPR